MMGALDIMAQVMSKTHFSTCDIVTEVTEAGSPSLWSLHGLCVPLDLKHAFLGRLESLIYP